MGSVRDQAQVVGSVRDQAQAVGSVQDQAQAVGSVWDHLHSHVTAYGRQDWFPGTGASLQRAVIGAPREELPSGVCRPCTLAEWKGLGLQDTQASTLRHRAPWGQSFLQVGTRFSPPRLPCLL